MILLSLQPTQYTAISRQDIEASHQLDLQIFHGASTHNCTSNLSNIVWKYFPLDLINTLNPNGYNFKSNHVHAGQVHTLLESTMVPRRLVMTVLAG